MTSLEGHPYTGIYKNISWSKRNFYICIYELHGAKKRVTPRTVLQTRENKGGHYAQSQSAKAPHNVTADAADHSGDGRRRRAGIARGMEVVEEKMVGFGKERLQRKGGGGGKGESVVLSLHLLFPSLSSDEKNPGSPPPLFFDPPLFLSERERDGQRSSDHDAPPPPAKQHSPPLVPPRSIYEARQKFASSSAYPPFAVSSYLTPQGGREGGRRTDG